jgi:hypothetical protein
MANGREWQSNNNLNFIEHLHKVIKKPNTFAISQNPDQNPDIMPNVWQFETSVQRGQEFVFQWTFNLITKILI